MDETLTNLVGKTLCGKPEYQASFQLHQQLSYSVNHFPPLYLSFQSVERECVPSFLLLLSCFFFSLVHDHPRSSLLTEGAV